MNNDRTKACGFMTFKFKELPVSFSLFRKGTSFSKNHKVYKIIDEPFLDFDCEELVLNVEYFVFEPFNA